MIRYDKSTNEVPAAIAFDTQADKQSVVLRTGSRHSGKLDNRADVTFYYKIWSWSVSHKAKPNQFLMKNKHHVDDHE